MKITNHGEERCRKRIGIPKKTVKKMAAIAMETGIKHTEAKGKLKKYFDYLFLTHDKARDIRIYSNHVWIFSGDTLITVYEIPKTHIKSSIKLLSKKRI